MVRSSPAIWCLGLVFAYLGLIGAASAADGIWSRSDGWQVSWNDDTLSCAAINVSESQESQAQDSEPQESDKVFVRLTVSNTGSQLVFFSPSWTFIRTGEKYQVGLLFDGRRYWGGESLGLASAGTFGFGVGATSGLLKDFAKKRSMRLLVNGEKKPLATYSLAGSFRALSETTACAEARERGGLRSL